MKVPICLSAFSKAAATALLLAALALLLPGPGALAQSTSNYIACLGCAEHQEIRTRWHRPLLTELAGEGFVMFDHFRLERQARDLGLCETDPLIRGPEMFPGCHPFSVRRAWLIEAPLELVAFTSPAWGLARRGHPRWAMALELVPILYHTFTIRATSQAIQQWREEQFLYH
ncbi:MAG: hypothetical protein ACRD01_03525 [Terriglobales bacterium]